MTNIALPTKNIVTQTAAEHGYPATDYAAGPDPDVHACVTGWAIAGGNPNNNPSDPNDCGWMIEQISDDGMWKTRTCHNQKTSWTKKYFKIGQAMAKIGYSGYTKPANSSGAHIHLVLFKKSGNNWVRVADPDATIRRFQMIDKNQVNVLVRFYQGKEPTDSNIKNWVGKKTFAQVQKEIIDGHVYAARVESAKLGKLKAENHLPGRLRTAYKPPASEPLTLLSPGKYEVK